jgi:hypothetical protein
MLQTGSFSMTSPNVSPTGLHGIILGMSQLVMALVWLASANGALFKSAVPYEPLVAKLKDAGGDPGRIVRVHGAAELVKLESGKRYKFALDEKGVFSVAPLPADAPHNEYVHPILAGGAPVRTAGGITVEHKDGKIVQVTLDQDSKSYCPTLASLDEAVAALARLGVKAGKRDQPPPCAH